MEREGPRVLCPICREPIDPDAPGTVRAVEVRDLPGFQQSHDYVDGMRAAFHTGCYPDGNPHYRRADD